VRIWRVEGIAGKKDKLSLVTQVITPQCNTLFCGDIGKKEQQNLSWRLGSALSSDIMTLPAHGKAAIDEGFLATVHPRLIIASTGKRKLPNFANIRMVSTNDGAQHILVRGTTIQTELLKD
jgi:beta-lactamase superfamily II metal-dependent hydrolase